MTYAAAVKRGLLAAVAGSGLISCAFAGAPLQPPGEAAAVRPAVLTGRASYYAASFNGRRTASGEPHDESTLTAAHRTLPFGSIVEVRNVKNGKTVRVRISDRGPFVKGRIIDLSKAAADKLDFVDDGVTDVELRIVRRGG